MRSAVKLGLLAAAAAAAYALLVAPGSPCESQCGNVLTLNTASDMTCVQTPSEYSSSAAGAVFEQCINCQLISTYTYNNQTDLQWMLYSLRWNIAYCLWGYAGYDASNNPCITASVPLGPCDPPPKLTEDSFACGPLQANIEYNNLTTTGGAYDYCSAPTYAWNSKQVAQCKSCLKPLQSYFFANFMVLLDAACQQQPASGTILSVSGSVFSTSAMTITSASPAYATELLPNYGAISLGARVGIAFGCLAFLLALTGSCIVMRGKRRRRRFLREMEQRYGRHPHHYQPSLALPGPHGGHMFETPVSQKPLRGWDNDSPVSAHTDDAFSSPSLSQHNSPVGGGHALSQSQHAYWPNGGHASQIAGQQMSSTVHSHWPASAQEKLQLQIHHDPQKFQQDTPKNAIGAALDISTSVSGEEISTATTTITKNNNRSSRRLSAKGKEREPRANEQAYEMHDVFSSSYSSHSFSTSRQKGPGGRGQLVDSADAKSGGRVRPSCCTIPCMGDITGAVEVKKKDKQKGQGMKGMSD